MVMARSHVRVQIAWLALIDLFCLLIGGVAGIIGRLGHGATMAYAFEHIDGWMMFFGGVILANYLAGSYRVQYTFSRFNLIVTWVFSLVFALFILSITSYAWFMVVLGRGVLLISIVVYSIVSLSLKLMVYRALFRSERFTCRTVIIGCGKSAEFCRRIIEKEFVLPAHKAVAFICVLDNKVELRSGSDFNDGVVIIYASGDKLEEVIKKYQEGKFKSGIALRIEDLGIIALDIDDTETFERAINKSKEEILEDFKKSITSCFLGRESPAPYMEAASAPSALANTAEADKLNLFIHPYNKPAEYKSPAPVVSIAFTGKGGHKNCVSPLAT